MLTILFLFFFKQKTAYEMRISDWSSDVCSSDLRAHQAAVFDAALASGDLRWGITGVSLRSAGVRDQMAAQDGLYALVVRDGEREEVRIIGAVKTVLVAPETPQDRKSTRLNSSP